MVSTSTHWDGLGPRAGRRDGLESESREKSFRRQPPAWVHSPDLTDREGTTARSTQHAARCLPFRGLRGPIPNVVEVSTTSSTEYMLQPCLTARIHTMMSRRDGRPHLGSPPPLDLELQTAISSSRQRPASPSSRPSSPVQYPDPHSRTDNSVAGGGSASWDGTVRGPHREPGLRRSLPLSPAAYGAGIHSTGSSPTIIFGSWRTIRSGCPLCSAGG